MAERIYLALDPLLILALLLLLDFRGAGDALVTVVDTFLTPRPDIAARGSGDWDQRERPERGCG
jgi:hypothetical protein